MSDTTYPPKPHLVDRAHISSIGQYEEMYRQSVEKPEEFWDQQASRLTFFQPYDRVCFEDFDLPGFSWFENAKLNVSYNCIDRHIEERGDQTAILWAKDEAGEYEHITLSSCAQRCAARRMC